MGTVTFSAQKSGTAGNWRTGATARGIEYPCGLTRYLPPTQPHRLLAASIVASFFGVAFLVALALLLMTA
jgi:hypothetical protein